MAAKSARIGVLLGVFIFALVGIALTPTVQEQVTGITGTGGNNLTGAALSLAGLIPLFWVLILIGALVAAVYGLFKAFS